jgi:hypothetical protein
MTKEDVKKVNVSIALSDYFKELEKIDPKLFKITTVSKASPFAPAYASGPDREVTTEMDLNQKIEVIKSKVQKDARFKNIVSKYQPVFDNLKFNPLDGTQLAEYMAYEGDAINAKKLKIGVALNSISGELSFKPDGSGNTVEIGDNGQAFINGVVKVPAKSVPRDVVKLLEAEGMAVDVVGETDEKDPKKTTTYYMFKAKVPSAIDLENAGMYFYGDEKDESKRSYLRQQIGAYLKTEFDTTNFEVTRNSAGVSTFSIKPNSPISSRLAQIDVDLYEKMTDGTFDFTVYKTIHDQITSLYSAKFNSRSEAAAAVKELESRLSPNDSPQSLSQRETTQAQGALQNAAQRPEFNVVRTALENEGFTPKGVSYWLGNFIQESGLNPSVVNEKEGAYGLAQWRLGRRDALEAFSGTKNPSVEDQMRFFFYELKQRVGPEEYNRIKNLTSASEIREVIKKYEGYGDEGYRTYFGQLLSEKMTTP